MRVMVGGLGAACLPVALLAALLVEYYVQLYCLYCGLWHFALLTDCWMLLWWLCCGCSYYGYQRVSYRNIIYSICLSLLADLFICVNIITITCAVHQGLWLMRTGRRI
ncbi:hypothetical protein RND81_01G018200 [Saponaria officinalis]|uniref:Uncharacterized protein n=1 Tax=Saponaria officinalis TaxID=3572 RepID=A0AAW1NC01_SAPOF